MGRILSTDPNCPFDFYVVRREPVAFLPIQSENETTQGKSEWHGVLLIRSETRTTRCRSGLELPERERGEHNVRHVIRRVKTKSGVSFAAWFSVRQNVELKTQSTGNICGGHNVRHIQGTSKWLGAELHNAILLQIGQIGSQNQIGIMLNWFWQDESMRW